MRTSAFKVVLLFSLTLLFKTSSVNAETAAERWGRAQTQYNSYEANRESRERNKPGYSNMSTPKTSQSTYEDNRPRSGNEVAAEHEAKMQAMHQKWAEIEAAQKRRREEEEARKRAAEEAAWAKDEAKRHAALRAVALKSDDKWNAYLNKLDDWGRQWHSAFTHSPIANLASDYLSGQLKDKKMSGEEAGRLILSRGMALGDTWSYIALARLEESQRTAEGEAKALDLYEQAAQKRMANRKEIDDSNKKRFFRCLTIPEVISLVKMTRVYAYGWGRPTDTAKATEYFQFLIQDHQYDSEYFGHLGLNPEPQYLKYAWADGITLYSEFMDQGIGLPQSRVGAQDWLKKALRVNNGNVPDKWKIVLTLLSIGGDLDSKQESLNILQTALNEGNMVVGGELVYKKLKGDGVAPNSEEAFKTALELPAMEPGALTRVARLWLGNEGVTRDTTKAITLLERYSEPNNKEHAQLLAEAKKG